MLIKWVAGRPLADVEAVVAMCKVSAGTVRRHCRPVSHEPRHGTGPGGGKALYDMWAAAEKLKHVAARPARRK